MSIYYKSGVEFRKVMRESKWIIAEDFNESPWIPANRYSHSTILRESKIGNFVHQNKVA